MFYQLPKQKTKSFDRALRSLILILSLGGNIPIEKPVFAQTILQCEAGNNNRINISNTGTATYSNSGNNAVINTTSNSVIIGVNAGFTTQITTVASQITDEQGNPIYGVSLLVNAVQRELIALGLTREEAATGSIAAIEQYVSSLELNSNEIVLNAIRQSISAAVPNRSTEIELLSDRALILALTNTSRFALQDIGLTSEEASSASNAAVNVFTTATPDNSFQSVRIDLQEAAINAASDRRELLERVNTAVTDELREIRNGNFSSIATTLPQSNVNFTYILANNGTSTVDFTIPNLQTLQETAITGSGTVNQVSYQIGNNELQQVTTEEIIVSIAPQQQLRVIFNVEIGTLDNNQTNAIAINFGANGCDNQQGVIPRNLVTIPPLRTPLIDPLGRILGCNGEPLDDYTGFSVGIFDADPNDPTGGFIGLSDLTTTEFPDDPNNNIPPGLAPNIENINPYPVDDEGRYNFLFDPSKGQIDLGRTYILIVDVPPDSIYQERRIRLVIGEPEDDNPNLFSYVATALDGRPISSTNGDTSINGDVEITNPEVVGLALAAFDLATNICEEQEVSITKTGDRATAQPGDIVLYRLTIRNGTTDPLTNLVITDVLPHGFNFKPSSVRGIIGDTPVTITPTINGNRVAFTLADSIPVDGVLNIVYGAEVTPDGLRGSGVNSAIVNALRNGRNELQVSDGPAIHKLKVRGGIISNAGIIVGRVFHDKNFDGEQQHGEPGIPNAVIFLQDGNRVTTDENGVFSVKNVLPGYHTGTLDLTSIRGYNLAPNLRVKERNSKSRLVRLAPSGMVRMNFAVSPTSEQEAE